MKVEKTTMKVGSRIKLNENVDLGWCIFLKDHEFNIISEGERGFNLEDDDGNKIGETGLMQYKLELVN